MPSMGYLIGGRYRLIERLGTGGMGSVYLAEQADDGRQVAVKLVAGEADERTLERFSREAQAATQLDSPHIARVLDVGRDPKLATPYLVMELLAGEDLASLIQRAAPLPPTLAVRIASQVLRGLEQAHTQQLIHRDIKPGNLFMAAGQGDTLVVKILDFGIVKRRGDDRNLKLTQTGTMVGSPMYMAPEQARGRIREIDARSDVFSVGVVLYEMLTGSHPLRGAESLGDLLFKLCAEDFPRVDLAAPWLDAPIADVVARCVERMQDERYRDAAELRAVLDELVAPTPIRSADLRTVNDQDKIGPLTRALT